MKTHYEIKSDRNKALSTLGYGIMWMFIVFLAGILPFYTGNGNVVFYIVGAVALFTGIFKLTRGVKLLKSNN